MGLRLGLRQFTRCQLEQTSRTTRPSPGGLLMLMKAELKREVDDPKYFCTFSVHLTRYHPSCLVSSLRLYLFSPSPASALSTHAMSSADLLTRITDLVLASEEDDLAEAVTSVVASARQLVTGSDFTVSLAPVAAIGSFLMIVGLAPFAGFWNASQS